MIEATSQPAGITLGSSDPLNADVAVRANFTTWASSGQFTMERSVYEGSDGHYYTEREMWRRLESAEWTVRCWDDSTGREWVITSEEELLALTPIDPDEARA